MSAVDKYVKLLKENNLKITPQRLSILRYVHGHNIHPTADEIYHALKKTNPSLSKTTIYNALDALRTHGLVQTLTISGSETRYEFKEHMHHHFMCTRCGTIIDIDLQCPNIKKMEQNGYAIDEIHGYFKGICIKCKNKGENHQ